MNKPALQLVQEIRAEKSLNKISKAAGGMNQKLSELHAQKMVIPNSSSSKATNSQNKISDADFDDLLAKKSSVKIQKKIDDKDFEALLESKPKKTASKGEDFREYTENKTDSNPTYQVEAQWKVGGGEDNEEEKELDDENDEFLDEEDDVHEAFNFTDTEFDCNNRDDYDIDTEVIKDWNQTLYSISEEDEESEKTIQRKKWEIEIIQHEKRIREYEGAQKQKWNNIIQYWNSDEKVAVAWYEFAAKKVGQLEDDKMEEISSEIQSFVYAHGIDQHENMAFELFCYIIKESDIQVLKEDLEAVKERVELI